MFEFKNDMVEAAAEQLSLDLACLPTDFLKEENTVVFSSLISGRRCFKEQNDFFHVACFGNGAVASVSKEIYPFAKALMEKLEGIRIFDAQGIYLINKELEKYGKAITGFNEYYLPKTPYPRMPECCFKLEIYEGEEISKLYGDAERFANALLFKNSGKRRDVLAVGAKNGEKLIGLAGASNDSERFWQIGVDVDKDFRRKGVASSLVNVITHEILMRGAIPYYGTWWSNIASRNTAIGCSYYPAWVEMSAEDIH